MCYSCIGLKCALLQMSQYLISTVLIAHRSCVIPFTKITMFPSPEQVQDIEHYCASVGDDLDAK